MKECPACSRCYPDHVNHCPADGDALRLTIAGDTVLDGRYQLERRLGAGGMGAVFKGRHVFLKTTHAIKVILPDLVGNDPTLVTRFRQEAMAAAAIHHPNIISVTDFGVANNTMPFLVMEFIEGRSLHELLAAEKRLDPARALEIMLAVAAGVGAAHREGIVHRDIKPLNIMLRDGHSAEGGVKVLDFGLAKIKSTDLLGSFVAAKTQGLMGSPFYMAPEQWGEDEPDLLADIYSMGVILYQMLAGEVPFRGNSIPAIMKKHLTDPPAPLVVKGVNVPPEVEYVLRHALEKELHQRTQSVEEFVRELRAALAAVRPSPELGSDTSPDIGMRTVAIKEPSTIPPAPPEALESQPAFDLAQGMKTVAEMAPPRGEAPSTMDDLIAPPDALPATGDLSPTQAPPSRETARGLAGGTLGIRPEEGKDGADAPALEETSLAPLPSDAETDAAARRRQTHVTPSKPTQPLTSQPQTGHPATAAPPPTPPVSTPSREAPPPSAPAVMPGVTAPLNAPPPVNKPAPPPMANVSAAPTVARGDVHGGVGVVPAGAADAVAPSRVPGAVASPRTRIPLPLLAAAGILALLCVVAGLYLYLRPPGETETNVNAGANTGPGANISANANSGPSPTPQPSPSGDRPETMVSMPGGTFQMGRDDVPPRTSDVSVRYQLWVYSQWPAHAVRVAPFFIDKTEVTNAEYAECVGAGTCAVPRDDKEGSAESLAYWKPWEGARPPAGQETWPVRNVSYADALAFAVWRSRRDGGVRYRLPTEAEWEYVARGGGQFRLFPWGDDWQDGRANVGAELPQAVGSYPQGATPSGVLDLIGNVWEWTSSQAAMYRGNNVLQLPPSESGKIVVRGGSYQSKTSGDEPITATARRWVARETRDPVVGFRLVRPAN